MKWYKFEYPCFKQIAGQPARLDCVVYANDFEEAKKKFTDEYRNFFLEKQDNIAYYHNFDKDIDNEYKFTDYHNANEWQGAGYYNELTSELILADTDVVDSYSYDNYTCFVKDEPKQL